MWSVQEGTCRVVYIFIRCYWIWWSGCNLCFKKTLNSWLLDAWRSHRGEKRYMPLLSLSIFTEYPPTQLWSRISLPKSEFFKFWVTRKKPGVDALSLWGSAKALTLKRWIICCKRSWHNGPCWTSRRVAQQAAVELGEILPEWEKRAFCEAPLPLKA